MLRKHVKKTLHDPVTNALVIVTKEFVAYIKNKVILTIITTEQFYGPGGYYERCYPVDVDQNMLRDISNAESTSGIEEYNDEGASTS